MVELAGSRETSQFLPALINEIIHHFFLRQRAYTPMSSISHRCINHLHRACKSKERGGELALVDTRASRVVNFENRAP